MCAGIHNIYLLYSASHNEHGLMPGSWHVMLFIMIFNLWLSQVATESVYIYIYIVRGIALYGLVNIINIYTYMSG